MRFGVVFYIGSLKIGDIVRPIRGGLTKVKDAPPLTITNPDGTKTKVESTRGWREPKLDGPEDFRIAYDAMTVVEVTNEYVTFVRPYYHVSDNGTPTSVGFEFIRNVPRDHGGHWYELIS